jgi:hypothetical protein
VVTAAFILAAIAAAWAACWILERRRLSRARVARLRRRPREALKPGKGQRRAPHPETLTLEAMDALIGRDEVLDDGRPRWASLEVEAAALADWLEDDPRAYDVRMRGGEYIVQYRRKEKTDE